MTEGPQSRNGEDRGATAGELWEKLQSTHPFPLSCTFAVTERCNLSCPHCYVARPSSREELSTDEITGLLDDLADLGTLQLFITGGEPALRSDLLTIVDAAASRRFAVTLKTNASLLEGADVDALHGGGLSEMNVSIYHHVPDRHDRFVGLPGAWSSATRALDRFLDAGGLARVSIVVMGWNADGVSCMVDLCEERGWRYSVDLRIDHRSDGGTQPCELRAGEEALLKVLADPRLFNEILSAPEQEKSPDSPLCLAGQNGPCVMPDGEVRPCQLLPWSLGNIRETPFREIWTASPVLEEIRALCWGSSRDCIDCEESWACQRCPADAFLEHGDITRPSSLDCALARAHARARRRRG